MGQLILVALRESRLRLHNRFLQLFPLPFFIDIVVLVASLTHHALVARLKSEVLPPILEEAAVALFLAVLQAPDACQTGGLHAPVVEQARVLAQGATGGADDVGPHVPSEGPLWHHWSTQHDQVLAIADGAVARGMGVARARIRVLVPIRRRAHRGARQLRHLNFAMQARWCGGRLHLQLLLRRDMDERVPDVRAQRLHACQGVGVRGLHRDGLGESTSLSSGRSNEDGVPLRVQDGHEDMRAVHRSSFDLLHQDGHHLQDQEPVLSRPQASRLHARVRATEGSLWLLIPTPVFRGTQGMVCGQLQLSAVFQCQFRPLYIACVGVYLQDGRVLQMSAQAVVA
mmetsp:Transcript_29581/g.97999  ORF Transcript_29581/g.97999 Transcript_29581/m.97999 type:complete len:342 (+) Transcript_29581:238-1263(+)